MTVAATMAMTERGACLDRGAQDRGLALFGSGAVEVIGGTLALVEDGGMFYGADEKGCGCGAAEERDGVPCSHRWAGRYAATAFATAGGETAA